MKVTTSRFDPSTATQKTTQVDVPHLRTPREGDALVSAARRWQGATLVTEGIADIALAALLDLLRDLPDDATVGDLRHELQARAATSMLERQR